MKFIYNTDLGITQISLQELEEALNDQRTIIAVLEIKSSSCGFAVILWDSQYMQFICHFSGNGFSCTEGGSEGGKGYKTALELIIKKFGQISEKIDIGLKGIHYSDYLYIVIKEVEDYLTRLKNAIEDFRGARWSEGQICKQFGLSRIGARTLEDELLE